MTDRDGLVWGVISVDENNPFGEIAFEIKDSLTIYEAARIASGRHPVPRLLDGAGIDAYWQVLTAGIDRKDWRRLRPQRSVDVFHTLMDAVEQGKITSTRLVYLTKPTYRTKGNIDWRLTRIKTMDVARLCSKKGWQPKLLRPPTGASTKRKEGRHPICDQEVIKKEVFRLMGHHSEFSACDPEWNCQAKLEKAIATFLAEKVGVDNVPVESTIRKYIKKPLAEWRSYQSVAKAEAKN